MFPTSKKVITIDVQNYADVLPEDEDDNRIIALPSGGSTKLGDLKKQTQKAFQKLSEIACVFFGDNNQNLIDLDVRRHPRFKLRFKEDLKKGSIYTVELNPDHILQTNTQVQTTRDSFEKYALAKDPTLLKDIFFKFITLMVYVYDHVIIAEKTLKLPDSAYGKCLRQLRLFLTSIGFHPLLPYFDVKEQIPSNFNFDSDAVDILWFLAIITFHGKGVDGLKFLKGAEKFMSIVEKLTNIDTLANKIFLETGALLPQLCGKFDTLPTNSAIAFVSIKLNTLFTARFLNPTHLKYRDFFNVVFIKRFKDLRSGFIFPLSMVMLVFGADGTQDYISFPTTSFVKLALVTRPSSTSIETYLQKSKEHLSSYRTLLFQKQT